MKRLCQWLAGRLPLRRISIDGEDYLLRYYVCGRLPTKYWPGAHPRLGWLPFSVYLHRFLRPDQDRALHNHPWGRSVSFVLSGGYLEERLDESAFTRVDGQMIVIRRLRAPAINVIRRDDYHRIAELHGRVWTLFITGRKVGGWGYRDRLSGESWEPG